MKPIGYCLPTVEVIQSIPMTSVQVQPGIPKITVNKYNMDKEQHCNKRLFLLVQPTASVFLSPGHTSASNSRSKTECGNSFSHSLPNLVSNVWVSGLNLTEPSLGISQLLNLPLKTNSHLQPTTNKFQQFLPINHFLIPQNVSQANFKSQNQTDISLDLGENKAQQVGKNDFNKVNKENETGDNSKEIDSFCAICDLRFWTKELLNSHLEGNQFSCRTCTGEFLTHSELESHFLSHTHFKCIHCKKSFWTRKDLCDHKKDAALCNPQLECLICKKKYSTSKSLLQHTKRLHFHIGGGKYKCEVCDKMYLSPITLNIHQKRMHVAYEKMKCKLCNVSCLGPEKLKWHIKLAHLRKKVTCPLPCPICGKFFYMENHLAAHIQYTHNDRSEILCEFCGKACKGKRSLFHHIKRHHKGLKNHKAIPYKAKNVPVICEVCGTTLKNKSQLKKHLQIHSNDRQFKCDVCNATFKQEAALRNHRTTHSSIRKYICSYCEKSFKWKHSFKKHEDKCKTSAS